MAINAFPLAALFASAVLTVGSPIEQPKLKWKGTIRVDRGVRTLRNPTEPLYGRLNLELQEELSIGNKNNKECLFSLISDVKSDNAGNIYVADTKNLRVQKFGRNGNFIKTLGKGIVQFEQPSRIKIHGQSGYIFVQASVIALEIFDGNGQHKGRIRVKEGPVMSFEPVDKSQVMAVLGLEYHNNDPRVTRSVNRLDTNGEMKSVSKEYFRYALVNIGEGWMAKDTGFEPELYLAKLDGNLYVYSYSKDYELNVIDKEGEVLYRIKKIELAPTFTSQEKKVFKGSTFPDLRPYFFHLLTDSKRRIYVQRNITKGILNAVQEKTNREVDIFSKDGYFLYTSAIPPNTCEIRDGLLYAYSVDELNGLETVKRYRIKDWEKIRAGILSSGS